MNTEVKKHDDDDGICVIIRRMVLNVYKEGSFLCVRLEKKKLYINFYDKLYNGLFLSVNKTIGYSIITSFVSIISSLKEIIFQDDSKT